MSGQTYDVNRDLGETYDYDRIVLPESYYPVFVGVGELGISDARQEIDAQGATIEKGNTPFVELTLSVYEGAFSGAQITRKAYITPGQKGGAIGRWLGACKAITRQGANTLVACQKFGIALPTPGTVTPQEGENADQAQRRGVREALAAGFYGLTPDMRLAFVGLMLNVPAWDGKQVIAHLGLESYKSKDGTVRYNNEFKGFIPLDDPKKGLGWVRLVELPKQVEAKKLMDAPADATSA